MLILIIAWILGLTGCQQNEISESTKINLSDDVILVNGETISKNTDAAVYAANDIIFYLENQDITYGEGTEADAHSQAEADAHTVIHITEPGIYEFTGNLKAGQIFVDLGDGTKNDRNAVATLVLNDVDISCTVAPAILFYRTYECADDNEEDAVMEVDTSAAGANLVLADGSINRVYGSYVAKIYESCELNEAGTEVVDSKKLHKYDGAVFSRRSMNISGTGALEVLAENEGICSEMHLTINGGDINITSGNDGVNTSEDNVSVFAMNEGTLSIQVTGETGEGDGIDSNGWLVVNGGTVNSFGCATSIDSGIDADKGIYINGGLVIATGNMPAEVAEGKQTVLSFAGRDTLEAGKKYEVKDAESNVVLEVSPDNAFTILTVSSDELLADGKYAVWQEDRQIADGMSGATGMFRPEMKPGRTMPEGMKPPEGMEPPERLRK